MRYNIIINQVKAKEWGLNLQQASVFSFFYELPSWAESIIEGDKIYYFASKNKAVEELPILTEKKDTMYRIYKQIEEKGLISIVKKDGKDYVLVTDKGKSWNDFKYNSEKNPNKLGKKSEDSSEKNPTYNITSINNITKDNINSGLSDTPCDSNVDKLKDQNIDFDALLVLFNDITGKKFRVINKKARKQFLYILNEGYTKVQIKEAIVNCFNSDFHKENKQYLTPEFISRIDKFEKYVFAKQKKQVLPKDFWRRELTDEQKKLLSPENLKHWERQKSAMQLEGGKLLPIKIVYEGDE